MRFDPRDALELIREHSPDWSEHLASVHGIPTELDAVPTLRYPMWVDDPPADVRALVDEGFDTIIRLPFDAELRPGAPLDEAAWLQVVRASFEDVTDEMLLLLGTFDRIDVRDQLAGERRVVEPDWEREETLADGTRAVSVAVLTNGEVRSRWRFYSRDLPGRSSLAGSIVVGARLEAGRLVPAGGEEPSAPFHLFFPTRIGSGLPFLVHGYFEVDAARTGFYEGSAAENDAVLAALGDLVACAVGDLARGLPTTLAPLADQLGRTGDPENPRARAFRDRVLEVLDELAWVPVVGDDGAPTTARPLELFVDEDHNLVQRTIDTFPAAYIHRRTSLRVPVQEITEHGLRYLRGRQGDRDIWSPLGRLLRPGPGGPWLEGHEDDGFRSLVELVTALHVTDPARADKLLRELGGDPDACLLPVVAEDGRRRLAPVPNVEDAAAGRRSRGVMARIRRTGDNELVPPSALDVAFLPAGLLRAEEEVDRAKPLGVREFTVDNLLDRLAGTDDVGVAPEPILAFLWSLLARERTGQFSTRSAATRSAEFDPGAFFWCVPGDGARGGAEQDRQRRRRALATMKLPALDGTWHAASTLAFGQVWADWLESGDADRVTAAMRARARAYRALEQVAPSRASLLAPPERVLGLLPGREQDTDDEDGRPSENAEKHAFLIMLGVWEILPVEAFEGRRDDQPPRPFPGPLDDLRESQVRSAGGWQLSAGWWSGTEHRNLRVSEDFRFRWPLEEAAQRSAIATASLLSAGSQLYTRLRRAAAFCSKCTSKGSRHTTRHHTTAADDHPSILAIELRHSPWVPAMQSGEALHEPQVAASTWWAERPPAGTGATQSPLQFLTLCAPEAEISPGLRDLARIPQLGNAPMERLEALLIELRDGLRASTLPRDPRTNSSARKAFLGLHRLAYERLDDIREEAPAEILERVGVLCDLGGELVHHAPAEARHDDGTHVTHRRYFEGLVPFVALARDKEAVAKRLGISRFDVELRRRPAAAERDVTDAVSDILAERIPELMSIVVHHSLGVQTLEPTSQDFEVRARRLKNLRVVHVDDLVIDAHVAGTDHRATIGERSGEDLFLEDPQTSHPVLYQDIPGERWKDVLRRKLPMHLAVLLENTAYAATFALFLLSETDTEREEVLQDLGISADEVDDIRSSVGAVGEEERLRHQRWFASILAALGRPDLEAAADTDLATVLVGAGLSPSAAAQIVDLGGGAEVRGDTSEDGALATLDAAGVPLDALDAALRERDPSDGLEVDVARGRLRRWLQAHRRRVSAVLASRRNADEAKRLPGTWIAPPELRLEIDPSPNDWLAPVLESLTAAGFDPDAAALTGAPVAELARLLGVDGQAALDAEVARLLDPEEQAKALRASAASWRRELHFLAVVLRTKRGESRSAIRAAADRADGELPASSDTPAGLAPAAARLLAGAPRLAPGISELLVGAGMERASRDALLALASQAGADTSHRADVERALEAPASERAQRTRSDIARLKQAAVSPTVPARLRGALGRRDRVAPGGRPGVSRVKVQPSADARKRQAGDEGERWMLTAVLDPLLSLPAEDRVRAIEELIELLRLFDGEVVDEAIRHAELASDTQLDEEGLIEELSSFLHLSRLSDAFGFDILGWLPLDPGAAPVPLCLEVKSSSTRRFHLSRSEWERATWFADEGMGRAYVVGIVNRGAIGAPPKGIDLLVDPVKLVEDGALEQAVDGYELGYAVKD